MFDKEIVMNKEIKVILKKIRKNKSELTKIINKIDKCKKQILKIDSNCIDLSDMYNCLEKGEKKVKNIYNKFDELEFELVSI